MKKAYLCNCHQIFYRNFYHIILLTYSLSTLKSSFIWTTSLSLHSIICGRLNLVCLVRDHTMSSHMNLSRLLFIPECICKYTIDTYILYTCVCNYASQQCITSFNLGFAKDAEGWQTFFLQTFWWNSIVFSASSRRMQKKAWCTSKSCISAGPAGHHSLKKFLPSLNYSLCADGQDNHISVPVSSASL